MAQFPRTRWTEIRAASAGDRSAFAAFVEKYRPPVVAYLERRGLQDEAEDLAQEVMLRFLDGVVLTKAAPDRGRFRSLVLAVTGHVLGHHFERRRAKKRGGDRQLVPLGELELAAPARDDEFDRQWVGHLLELALDRLAAEHPNYHQALRRFLLEEQPHAEIAAALGCSRQAVKNWVHRGKKKVIGYVQDELRRTTSSEEEYLDELQQLSRFLPL